MELSHYFHCICNCSCNLYIVWLISETLDGWVPVFTCLDQLCRLRLGWVTIVTHMGLSLSRPPWVVWFLWQFSAWSLVFSWFFLSPQLLTYPCVGFQLFAWTWFCVEQIQTKRPPGCGRRWDFACKRLEQPKQRRQVWELLTAQVRQEKAAGCYPWTHLTHNEEEEVAWKLIH